MPVIVFEGPDESGKTTLAQMIFQQLTKAGFEDVDYQRSPVKEFGWSDNYNHYLTNLLDVSDGRLIIQDRVPEISESIYGTIRGNPRNIGYTYDLYHWLHQNLFMVFCQGHRQLEDDHRDAIGGMVTQSKHAYVRRLYDMVYHEIRHVSMFSSSPLKAIKYDRWDPSSWLWTTWYIREWLCYAFAWQQSAINRALDFNTGDEFPMPSEFQP